MPMLKDHEAILIETRASRVLAPLRFARSASLRFAALAHSKRKSKQAKANLWQRELSQYPEKPQL